jgi:hypothetical protein
MLTNRILGLAGIVALVAIAYGCETSERPRLGPPPYDTTSPDQRPVVVDDDFEALEGYTYDQQSEFQTKAEEALNRLDRKIDEWKMKAREATADTREAWDAALADLRMKREAVRQSFSRIREATDQNWDELKAGFRRAWEDLEDSFEEAKEKLQ